MCKELWCRHTCRYYALQGVLSLSLYSTQRVPTRLQPQNCFRIRQSTEVGFTRCGLLFQPLGRWVHVPFFVLVHVEVRVGHVCCEGVIRLLETQEVDDASGARSRARRTSYIASSLLFSLESCSDAVSSVVQIAVCRHSLLADSCVHVHSLVHSNSASRPSSFRFASPVSVLSTRGSSNSQASSKLSKYSAGSSSLVPDIVTPATIILRCRGFRCRLLAWSV